VKGREKQVRHLFVSFRSVACTELAYAAADLTPNECAQRHPVGVTDLGGNLVNTGAARLQQMHRAFDAKILKVRERGLAQHGLQATRQSPFACNHCAGRFAERKAVSQLASCPPLEPLDERVRVRKKGFVIIGVHSPEFSYEHDFAKVTQYIQEHDIRFPIPIDNEFSTWNR
jgi:hypothetical protein